VKAFPGKELPPARVGGIVGGRWRDGALGLLTTWPGVRRAKRFHDSERAAAPDSRTMPWSGVWSG